jgi:D-glycero-D-manno-heptose 1,7-bisphosphate phosphatase
MVSRETSVPMKLIILARDVIIAHNPALPIESAESWIPVPGSLEAVARLTNAGYHVVAITGSTPMLSIETLNRIHEKMYRLTLEAGGLIEAIFFSADGEQTDESSASATLILEDIRRRLKLNLQGVPVVSIAAGDLQTARKLGATPILVSPGAGVAAPAETIRLVTADLVFNDLVAVADFILAQPDPMRQ